MATASIIVGNTDEHLKPTAEAFENVGSTIGLVANQVFPLALSTKAIDEVRTNVIRSIDAIAQSSETIAASSEEISACSEQQTASTEEVISSIHELTLMIKTLDDVVNRFKL